MKKLIQISSMLGVMLAFSVIAANAQTVRKLTAAIPFDFSVEGKQYKAGEYKIKIAPTNSNNAIVSVIDSENKVLDTLLLAPAGRETASGTKLTFNPLESGQSLSKIVTPDATYKLLNSGDGRVQISKKRKDARTGEVVSLALRTEL